MKKDKYWKELLKLMNEDSEWYKKPNTERYKRITTLGDRIYRRKQLNGVDTIDEQKFLTLVHYGYTFKQIALEFNVSRTTLHNWREARGYIKKRKTKLEEAK